MPENPQYDGLVELALNLRWSWHHSSDELWGKMNPELWELTQNPWAVLQTVSEKRLSEVCADPNFVRRVDELLREKREAVQKPTWFQTAHPGSPLGLVAYFSMEYMPDTSLP